MKTDIPQPDEQGVRLNSRKSRRSTTDVFYGEVLDKDEPAGMLDVANVHAAELEDNARDTNAGPGPAGERVRVPHGQSTKWKSVMDKKGPPSVKDLDKLTRNDVELFFEASHAFRTNLAGVLPDIAKRLGKFILAVPYTIVDSGGRPVQMVPDVDAMTPVQAKLAGLVLNRLLPPIADMDIDGKPGPNKGGHIDARQVKITINTVGGGRAGAELDRADALLRNDGRAIHPNEARQIAPVTMNLREIVERAQDMGATDTIDPNTIESDEREQSTHIRVDREDD